MALYVDTVGPALQILLECGTEALVEADRDTGMHFVSPGGQVAWDNCCDTDGGMLWSRVVQINPSQPDDGRCGVPVITARLALGVIRCVATITEDGFPSEEDMTADALKSTADMATLLGALECCARAQVPRLKIVQWNPLGNEGGCGGGEWLVDLVANTCGCPDE